MLSQHSQLLAQLKQFVDARQFRRALMLLNGTTPFRFSALYRFTPSGAANLVIYDKTGDVPAALLVVPPGASYCEIVRDTQQSFITFDSHADARLRQHVSRDFVQSYVGFPVTSSDGSLIGTLCHFDYVPHDANEPLFALSQQLIQLLDETSGLDELQQDLLQKLDALAAMSRVLIEASQNTEELAEAFEIYAAPIRLQADALGDSAKQCVLQQLTCIWGLMVTDAGFTQS